MKNMEQIEREVSYSLTWLKSTQRSLAPFQNIENIRISIATIGDVIQCLESLELTPPQHGRDNDAPAR